jgi:hypothetical protein
LHREVVVVARSEPAGVQVVRVASVTHLTLGLIPVGAFGASFMKAPQSSWIEDGTNGKRSLFHEALLFLL